MDVLWVWSHPQFHTEFGRCLQFADAPKLTNSFRVFGPVSTYPMLIGHGLRGYQNNYCRT